MASQTKNRYKGTGSGSNSYGGFSSESYGKESYGGYGSSSNDRPKKKRDRESEERHGGYDNDRNESKYGGYGSESNKSGGGSKGYDPNPGQSNLMKKLGIQAPVEARHNKAEEEDEDIEFPKEAPAKVENKMASPPKPTTGMTSPPKFLPPPPSKNGSVSTGTPGTQSKLTPQNFFEGGGTL